MPDVEIDIDDLLDADGEEERALKLRVSSFQNLEPSSHRCLNPLGSPRPAEGKAMGCWLRIHPHEVHL